MFETDCAAMTVHPPSLDLPPFTGSEIAIHFDSTKLYEREPRLYIQCEETSESRVIPLQIVTTQTKCLIDFGVTTPGTPITKTLHVTPTIEVKSLDDFFVEESPDGLTITFCGDHIGTFSSYLDVGEYLLTLAAEVVEPGLDLETAVSNYTLRNTSGTPQHIFVSCAPDFTDSIQLELGADEESTLASNAVYVRSNYHGSIIEDQLITELAPIDISVNSLVFERPGQQSFSITNNTGDPTRLTLQIDSPEFETSDASIFLRPNMPRKVTVTYSPTSLIPAVATLTLLDPSEAEFCTIPLRGSVPLKARPRLIPFLQLNGSPQTVAILVLDAEDVRVTVPDWIEVTNSRTLGCSEPSFSSMIGNANFEANGREANVPILAYRGASNITHSSIHVDDDGFGSIEVQNHGTRTGFVIFSAPGAASDIELSPSSALLKPNETTTFRFHCPTARSVVMHTGDEILREIRAAVEFDSFYAFDDSTREINNLDMSVIPRKTFLHLFNEYTQTLDIELVNTST